MQRFRLNQRKWDSVKLLLMILPFLVLVFLFSYLPLAGWRYAFYDYRPGFPLEKCKYVGFKWFLRLVETPAQTSEIIRVMKNTLGMSTLGMLTSVCPMFFAISLSQVRSTRYRKTLQVLTTLPNFISWVLIFSVAFSLFSVDTGFINRLLISMGVIDKGINFLADGNHMWIKMTLWNLWKSIGWNSILYLATLASIDQELYEAAQVDGANRFRQTLHITLPGLMPTFFVLLLSIGNFINTGMESYFVFQNAMNKDTIEVLDLYVYNIGMGNRNFSLATAIGMLKSVVSIVLLFAANTASRLIRGESLM